MKVGAIAQQEDRKIMKGGSVTASNCEAQKAKVDQAGRNRKCCAAAVAREDRADRWSLCLEDQGSVKGKGEEKAVRCRSQYEGVMVQREVNGASWGRFWQ